MFFSNGSALKAHLKQNIDNRTWYFAYNHGLILAIHAWYAESAMNGIRAGHKPGIRQRTWNIWQICREECLLFTDREEIHKITKFQRQSGSVAGNLDEFELFQNDFTLSPHSLFVPSASDLSKPYQTSHLLGDLKSIADYMSVKEFAHSVNLRATADFR